MYGLTRRRFIIALTAASASLGGFFGPLTGAGIAAWLGFPIAFISTGLFLLLATELGAFFALLAALVLPRRKGTILALLIAVGSISLALGVVGIVLPLVPTTPFLLLAAACFARSSGRLHDYLVGHRVLGTYISNYYEKAMTRKDKARTLTVLWVGIGLSVWLIGEPIPAIILPLIALAVTIHILRLSPRG